MTVSQLQALELDASVAFGGESVALKFRPGAYTSKFVDGLGEQQLADALSEILTGWDLQEDDGKPYPLSPEAIGELPIPFLRACMRAVSEAAFPN